MFKKLGLGLFAIVFMFSSMGLSCDDDDDATCRDAAKNIVKVFLSEGTQTDLCDAIRDDAEMTDQDYNDCLAMTEVEGIDALTDWCTDEDDEWDQSDIDCLSEADSLDDIEDCTDDDDE